MKMIRTSVWLDRKQVEELKRISKRLDRTIGWLVRKGVDELLKKRNEKKS